MFASLPARQRRALALLLLLVPLALLVGLVCLPFWLMAQQDSELAAVRRQIESLEARQSVRGDLLAEEQRLRETRKLDELVIEAATPALAAADLQAVLTSLVKLEGGEVSSVQIAEPKAGGPFTEVRMRMSTRLTLANLRHLLYSIETMTPLLLLETVELSADSGAQPGEPLDAALDIVAWTRIVPPQQES
jgi:hypothetical protein